MVPCPLIPGCDRKSTDEIKINQRQSEAIAKSEVEAATGVVLGIGLDRNTVVETNRRTTQDEQADTNTVV